MAQVPSKYKTLSLIPSIIKKTKFQQKTKLRLNSLEDNERYFRAAVSQEEVV
jgi:hypothetical protein